jgi:hypothetical protein
MVDDAARDRAIYHALKAVDEVAAALQTYLIEEHGADPARSAPHSPSTNSLKLLRQAREHLGQGCEPSRTTSSPSPTRSPCATGERPGDCPRPGRILVMMTNESQYSGELELADQT